MKKTKLTEDETDFFINWFLTECNEQYSELEWLIHNLTEETKEEIKNVVKQLKN